PEHKSWFFYLQRLCNHCSYPACLAACPRKAIYKRKEDGIVLVDQERCRGYRKCMEACPYKKTMHNTETRVTEKCIGCYPRIEGREPLTGGVPTETRCMTACVGQIRLQGLVPIDPKTGDWREQRDNPLYYLVRVAKVALPLYPQFGTEPNIYYIPPRWVPRPYLRQMFGPGVDAAIEAYSNPSRELLAVMNLFRKERKIVFRYAIEEGPKVYERTIRGRKFTMYDDTVVGYGRDGQEIVRVKIEEPMHVRSRERSNAV
ncbi:MAG: nitrate oxidoreductase subunit beta, partial [Elusimicrobia bacterium CG_4_10_14_0_2_um_filter_63_34]